MAETRDWQGENRKVIEDFRAEGGKDGLILVTMTGARSGLPRTIPLLYSTDGDRLFVIASKGGSPTHPDWYHNLVANPLATIEEGTEKFPVRAVVAEGEERQRLFDKQAARWPFFAEYQKNTRRQIPVIIFERVD
jgi:deazaflavin-dependent oxidoreductase (nitroreductase family)